MDGDKWSHSKVDEDDSASRYPNVERNHEGIEVVPTDTPLYTSLQHQGAYPIPVQAPLQTVQHPEPPPGSTWVPQQAEEKAGPAEPRRILGLSVRVFWLLVILLIILLAGGIGGGIAGGLLAQRSQSGPSSSDEAAASANTSTSPSPSRPATSAATGDTNTAATAVPSATQAASGPVPSDGGCPDIDGEVYTPYTVADEAIPLEAGGAGQRFRQQCWTRWTTGPQSRTHDILSIYMPSLETCAMACAEYNQGYRAGLRAGTGVGGGYCVAVTVAKEHAGFCFLRNGTGVNDTDGRPGVYSSAVLLTDTDMDADS